MSEEYISGLFTGFFLASILFRSSIQRQQVPYAVDYRFNKGFESPPEEIIRSLESFREKGIMGYVVYNTGDHGHVLVYYESFPAFNNLFPQVNRLMQSTSVDFQGSDVTPFLRSLGKIHVLKAFGAHPGIEVRKTREEEEEKGREKEQREAEDLLRAQPNVYYAVNYTFTHAFRESPMDLALDLNELLRYGVLGYVIYDVERTGNVIVFYKDISAYSSLNPTVVEILRKYAHRHRTVLAKITEVGRDVKAYVSSFPVKPLVLVANGIYYGFEG